MRLCVPTETNSGLTAPLFDHFGSAPFLTIIDTETAVPRIIPNPGCAQPHQSRHHIQQLLKHRVDAVVCRGVGRQALAALSEAGIQVLVPTETTVSDVITAVLQGRTRPLTEHQACGGSGRHAGRRSRSLERPRRRVTEVRSS